MALSAHPARASPEHLFVNSRHTSQALAVNTLSAYLCSVLRLSHSVAISSLRLPSMRSIASDKALRQGIGLEDILLMGNWSSSMVFQHHYRRSRQVTANISEAVINHAV